MENRNRGAEKQEQSGGLMGWIVIVVLLLGLVGGVWWWLGGRSPQPVGESAPTSAAAEAAAVHAVLKEILVLSKPDEVPQLSPVTDLSKLQAQNFFRRAALGDDIVVYKENGMIVLYRPSTKQVVNLQLVDAEVKK